MEGPERRFVKFGGGASDAQMGWLRQTLATAAADGQRVILCCHLPLHPDTCPGACLLWNYQEVLEACWHAGNVVATFSGHAHEVQPAHLIPCGCSDFDPQHCLIMLHIQHAKCTYRSMATSVRFCLEPLMLS